MLTQETTVLIVDDDPAHLRMVAKLVELAGYQVATAESGQEALDQIKANCPDMLITDWEMPEMSGLELCQQVQTLELPHYLYTIFLSCRSEASHVTDALQAGADDYMRKPVERDELVARLYSGLRIVHLERQLSRLANTDPLTGLPTKRTFNEHFYKEWARSERYRLPLSLAILDVDFFKRINDTHGHPAGDEVLKEVGKVVADSCRMSDFHCRYGGEEFCVLLPETDERQAIHWADQTRQKLADLVFKFDGEEIRITASFGVSQRDSNFESPESLVEAADQGLLVAKQSGRDRVVGYSSIDDDANLNEAAIEGEEDPFHELCARDAMTILVAPLHSNDPLEVAAQIFLDSRLGSTPVVDEQGHLAGILSEKDLLCAMLERESWDQTVGALMKPNVVAFESSTPLKTVYNFLCRVSIRQVIIVEDGSPVGAISRSGLVRWYGHWLEARPQGTQSQGPQNQELQNQGYQKTSSESNEDIASESVLQLANITSKMSDQLDALINDLGKPSGDLTPIVVGSATRIQELAYDLLAFASSSSGAFTAQSLPEAQPIPEAKSPAEATAPTTPVDTH